MNLPRRVLLVGGHCDDIELMAGGLLARLCFAGHAVGVLVFSDHRGIVSDAQAAAARAEFQANLAWLSTTTGTTPTDHSGPMWPACMGKFEAERAQIYAALAALRDDYDLVLTHGTHDTNQDHRQVAQEAQRVFKAHATLLAGEFPNNDLGDFHPQVYIALTAREVDAKIAMVQRYASQQFGGRPYFDPAAIHGLAAMRGAQIRAPFAEAFAVSGRVRVPA